MDSTEMLLHIGIDTVNLKGKYFNVHVHNGDTVKQGDLLVSFDIDSVRKEGYNPVTMLVFPNKEQSPDFHHLTSRTVTCGEQV